MSHFPWTNLPAARGFTDAVLAEILIGGQAFRWFWQPKDQAWLGIWDRNVVRLRLGPDGALQYTSPTDTSPAEITAYLALGRSARWAAALPRRADPVLAAMAQRWSRLSILAQPPGETLLAFLCSSNKRIPHIRAMLHNLAVAFGRPLPQTSCHALPDWPTLAAVPEDALRRCALGYRAAHVHRTARFLHQNPGFLATIPKLAYPEAHHQLCQLPGVGPKVADCVLLFGFGFGQAFPVDTWIQRALADAYPELATWSRPAMATFARVHFGPAAGLAQQWFFAERRPPLQRQTCP